MVLLRLLYRNNDNTEAGILVSPLRFHKASGSAAAGGIQIRNAAAPYDPKRRRTEAIGIVGFVDIVAPLVHIDEGVVKSPRVL